MYADLSDMSDDDVETHYINHGHAEGRIYNIAFSIDGVPSDFDATTYKSLNKDLRDLTDTQAIAHYHRYGRLEKRRYHASSNAKNTISNLGITKI